MAYHVAIVDDDVTDARYMQNLLDRWSKERQISICSEVFSSAENFLFHFDEDKTFEILLLDIEMGKMDGVTLARHIRRGNETVQIIFITGYSDYIAEGYEVAALHYLMKPVDEQKLFTVLDRACAKLVQDERCLNLTLTGEMVRIPLREVRYLDVHQNYTTVHAKKDYTVKRTLGELEKLLDERFSRAGRALIVNLTYISRVTKTEVFLSDGSVLPLPRGAYESLNRAIIAHT